VPEQDTPQAALIAACTVAIEAGKDRSSALATMYFHRGDAYREKAISTARSRTSESRSTR